MTILLTVLLRNSKVVQKEVNKRDSDVKCHLFLVFDSRIQLLSTIKNIVDMASELAQS